MLIGLSLGFRRQTYRANRGLLRSLGHRAIEPGEVVDRFSIVEVQ
jgi:hypothetical protein